MPDAGRLTKNIDIAVRRRDVEKIAKAAQPFGRHLRRVAGIDMLVQAGQPSARRAAHLVFTKRRLQPEAANDRAPAFEPETIELLPTVHQEYKTIRKRASPVHGRVPACEFLVENLISL